MYRQCHAKQIVHHFHWIIQTFQHIIFIKSKTGNKMQGNKGRVTTLTPWTAEASVDSRVVKAPVDLLWSSK